MIEFEGWWGRPNLLAPRRSWRFRGAGGGARCGKRPPVRVTINGYLYRSTVAVYGNTYYLPLRREVREGAGVDFGQMVPVRLELDDDPRTVDAPSDLAQAFEATPAASEVFDRLSYSHRREYVDWIESAKNEETRANRVQKAVDRLLEGKRLKG